MRPKRFRGARPEPYEVSEAQLAELHRAVWSLSIEDEPAGHLACVVGSMVVPTHVPWPWFVVVRPNGDKEPPFEDHGPLWLTVRELDAGYLDHREAGTRQESRFLGFRTTTVRRGPEVRYSARRLSPADAAAAWSALALVDDDF